ncbi:MAG: hypothetical protein H5U18_12715, partial [Rhodobacteraceae bacterium]|nr:hypothetical protein [Paracoccaceae bacterium]
EIEIERKELPRGEIEKGIVKGWVDITVILVSNLASEAKIDRETLFRSRRRLWLPADHRLLGAEAVRSLVAGVFRAFMSVALGGGG